MKETGGYFELELAKGTHRYHDTPYVMKSGRAALHHIFNYIKPNLVYIPYYTCNALLEPFKTTNIRYEFYTVNKHLEPENLVELKPGEYFLYINYLDLKRETVAALSEKYKDKLIVDCTQAFFMKGNNRSWFFNSCRKFFGVPDGSYIYLPEGIEIPIIENRNEEYIIDHLLKRFNGYTQEGYEFFVQNELLAGIGVFGISLLSEYLLSHIDYVTVIEKRRSNYNYLHDRLKHINLFDASLGSDNVPMSYPLLSDRNIDKDALIARQIFIPTFWKDTLSRKIDGFEFEKSLSDKLCPLPVDQRNSIASMELVYKSLFDN